MNETVVPQVVRSYLEQLRVALADVPEGVGREIIAGITEELAGLDAATAAARIEELGDPAFIAAEALAGVGSDSLSPHPESGGDPRWYTIVAAALVLAGGIVLPLIGWVVGVAMLWSSRTWKLGDKLLGTLILPGGWLCSLLLVVLPVSSTASGGVGLSDSTTSAPGEVFGNIGMILVFALPLATFSYLLWRAFRTDATRFTRQER